MTTQVEIWLWEIQMHRQTGNIDAAIKCIKNVLSIDCFNEQALVELQSVYTKIQSSLEIEGNVIFLAFKKTIEDLLITHCNDIADRISDDYIVSIRHITKLLEIVPDFCKPALLNNRASAYRILGKYTESFNDLDNAILLDPNLASNYINKAVVYSDLNDFKLAEEMYKKGMLLDPKDSNAHFSLSIVLLKQGRYAEGFKEYRYRLKEYQLGNIKVPEWTGEKLKKGKKLLVVGEQGFGDLIMYARYFPMIKELGLEIYLCGQPALFSLFEPLGVSKFIPAINEHGNLKHDNSNHGCDYYCCIADLPKIFKTNPDTIPLTEGYLQADSKIIEKWKNILGSKTKPRVGIVWAGNPTFLTDYKRSMSLETFLKAIPSEFECISLQKEFKQDELDYINESKCVKVVADHIEDFTDTAALIELVDLVVSVDTSVLNLAGALGKEAWAMLPFSPDWRWFANWYSSITQYRQPKPGDWASVLSEVKEKLQAKYKHESS